MIENIEKTVLSSLIYNYDLFEKVSLKPEHFYNFKHKKIFEVLQKLYKKELPFDEILIQKELDKSDEELLLEIFSIMSISNTSVYEKLIIDEYEKRELKKFLTLRINELETETEINYLQTIHLLNSYDSKSLSTGGFNIVSTKNVKAEKPEILIPKICPIQKKEINLFTSKGGVGKSFSLLYLMEELQKEGFKCFGFFSEDSVGVTKNRIEILKNTHLHLADIDIDILGKETRLQNFIKADKNGNFDISDFFYQFQKAMKPYDIIVIDPLISLIFKDENSNVEARYLMNLLNAWIEKEDKTLLLIHHDGKGENAGSRGASAFIDAVRIHYSISKIENQLEKRKLKLEKSNHYSGDSEFEITLFSKSSLNKPIEIVYESKEVTLKKKKSVEKFEMDGIEILYDESPIEETSKLRSKMLQKGVLFDE
jgi:replicative DNA helicase